MYNDETWLEIRSDASVYMRNEETSILKEWLNSINYTDPVGYYRDIRNKTMILYAAKPGFLIGKTGININKFAKMLSDKYHGNWKVEVIEIRGGFVNIGGK